MAEPTAAREIDPGARLAWGTPFALAGIALVALSFRSRNVTQVFPAIGEVILRGDDAQYHARRARFGFESFPSVLEWDPLLNHPHGAFYPWPPLWDFLLSLFGRAATGDPETFYMLLAWAPAVVGSATAALVYLAARALEPRAVAFLAAGLFAITPVAGLYGGLGNPDHHVAVAFESTALLACALHLLRGRDRGGWRAVPGVGLALARAALILTWQGSVAYLLIAEPALLAILALSARRRDLLAYSAGALGSAMLVAGIVFTAGSPTSATFSPLALSRFHVALPVILAAVAAVMAFRLKSRETSPSDRVATLAALGLLAVGALLALTQQSGDLAVLLAYAGKGERYIATNYENVPIRSLGEANQLFARLIYLLPALPPFLLWRARDPAARPGSLFLFVFTCALGGLAVANTRFANDIAPTLAIVSAAFLVHAARAATRPLPRSRAVATIAVLLAIAWLMAAPLARLTRAVPLQLAFLTGTERPRGLEHDFHRGLAQFAVAVREATPPAAGPGSPARPDYGILCFAALGPVLNQIAERATTAGGFGPYLGGDGFQLSNRFYALESEAQGLRVARHLGVRYVATSREGRPRPAMLLHRLHHGDGSGADGRPALAHFRLVTEAPARGIALGSLSGAAPRLVPTPFKLFEIVAGAQLEARAAAGTAIRAEVDLLSPAGRHFRYRTSTTVPASGIVRLRVPYSTDGETPTRALATYRVTIGEIVHAVAVREADVLAGAVIPVTRGEGSTSY